MLKEKRNFEIGEKIIVFGGQSSVILPYKIGTIINIEWDRIVPFILVEFEHTITMFYDGNGRGEKNKCFNIVNHMDRKFRTMTFYEYNEEELEKELEEFNKRYCLKVIESVKDKICRRSTCDSCPLKINEGLTGCTAKSLYCSQKTIYNTFVNITKKELEEESEKIKKQER